MNTKVLRWVVLILISTLFTTGCTTDFLGKYSSKNRKNTKTTQPSNTLSQSAPIVALDANTYRFHQDFSDVWNGALDILLENYNLTIVDRRSGIITTEWDSFYIGDTVYRNKLSLRLKKISFNMVDVTVHNSVEAWKTIDANGIQAAWLPAKIDNDEMARIIQNMAIAMNLPKPIIPKEAIATGSRNKLQ